jgi:DNA-binding NarL/FixJ family response regulator
MASGEAFGLLLTDDMIFSSRITGTARSLGLRVSAVKSVEDLISLARNHIPACVIIDLSHPGLQVSELIPELKEACSSMPRMIAYGSHVDAATLHAAREAGCDVVLPRSQFVENLPHELAAWMKASGA